MAAKRNTEPVAWMLFSAGGMAAALAIPALLFLLGLAFPLGWIDPPSYAYLENVLSNPLTVIAVLGLVVLALLHWAHRFRHTLYDALALKHLARPIAVLCYAGVVVGSALAVYVYAVLLTR